MDFTQGVVFFMSGQSAVGKALKTFVHDVDRLHSPTRIVVPEPGVELSFNTNTLPP